MPREVTDQEGTMWTAAEAYQGLEGLESTAEAAKMLESRDHIYVVCTPTGGAQTVRLKLQSDWETSCSDEQLVEAIQSGQPGGPV